MTTTSIDEPFEPCAEETAALRERLASHAAVIAAIGRVSACRLESDAVAVILDLLEELCAPKMVGFVPNDPGAFGGQVIRPATSESVRTVAAVASSLAPAQAWQRIDGGFAMTVPAEGAGLGTVLAIDVAFTESVEECAHLVGQVLPALATVLDRARAEASVDTVGLRAVRESRTLDEIEALRAECQATGEALTVALIDLDGLAHIDREHGVSAGHAVREAVLGRIRGKCRAGDVVGALGSAQIVAAVRTPLDPSTSIAARLGRDLRAPFVLPSGVQVACPATIGVATSLTEPGPARALLDAADRARGRSKNLSDLTTIGIPDSAKPANAQWATAIDALSEGIIVQDRDSLILHANPAAHSILGLADGFLIGRSLDDLRWHGIHADGTPFARHEYPHLLASISGRPVADVTMGVVTPSRATRWVVATAVPLSSADDGSDGVLTTLSDFTHERVARQVSHDQAQFFRQAIDSLPNPVYIFESVRDDNAQIIELRYVHLNLAGARLYGCRVADVVGRGQIELFPSVIETGIFDRYVNVIETGRADTFEIPKFDENGVVGSFELVVSPLGDGVVVSATEISARRALISQLAASEARFARTFGDSPLPMALIQEPTDAVARILLQTNPAMSQYLGLNPEAEHGQPLTEESPSGLGVLLATLDECAPIARGTQEGRRAEFQFTHPAGETRWVDVALTEIDDPVAGSRIWVLQITDTTEQRAIASELQYAVGHDGLTGLPDRGLLIEGLDADLATVYSKKSRLAVLVLNIDDFKAVNIELGLEAGDTYLKGCAELLASTLQPDDRLARLGGDEFGVVLHRPGDDRRLGATVDSMLKVLNGGVRVNNSVVSAAASVGVATSSRKSTPEALLSAAGVAMREAKVRGGNQWAMAAASRTRAKKAPPARSLFKLEADLREAVSSGGLIQRYQPIYDLRTGRLDCVEALTRWVHPTLGTIPPDEFINIAERRNIIGALGQWSLETACARFADWQDRFGTQAPDMAVNVSTRQLGNRSLPKLVKGLFEEYQLPFGRLWLEVTESQVMAAEGPATSELAALREIGARIAVDDFGTGYAGFGYLRSLPTDALKIDRSFVEHVDTDQTAAAIAASMVALGRSLEIGVIAEGIETPSQLEVMRGLGSGFGQGWLWRPALGAADIELLFGQDESAIREG